MHKSERITSAWHHVMKAGEVVHHIWEPHAPRPPEKAGPIIPFLRVGRELAADLHATEKLGLVDSETEFFEVRLTSHVLWQTGLVEEGHVPNIQQIVAQEARTYAKLHKRALEYAAQNVASVVIDETRTFEYTLEGLRRRINARVDNNTLFTPLFVPGKHSDIDRQLAMRKPDIILYRELAKNELRESH